MVINVFVLDTSDHAMHALTRVLCTDKFQVGHRLIWLLCLLGWPRSWKAFVVLPANHPPHSHCQPNMCRQWLGPLLLRAVRVVKKRMAKRPRREPEEMVRV